jgi:DNA (cytosine-5)-methyltransferase 1
MEAASVAWHPLGWTPVGFSEIEPFPCAILKHRFPNVPNYGSLTEYQSWPLEQGAIDLLVGGTPCQSFSVAGLRKGLADPRGNLALTFLGLADKLKPKWIVWENVPGVLSSNGGRDFGSFVGALGQLGYGWAMRILDAQHFGVPQRRRRVFVVACLGDWRAAAEVLSLGEGLRGYLETGNKKRKATSSDAGASAQASRINCQPDGISGAVTSKWSKGSGGPAGDEHYNMVAQPTPFRKSKRACSTTDNETWVLANSSNTLNNFDLGDTPTIGASGPPYSRTGNERVEAEALAVTTSSPLHFDTYNQTTSDISFTLSCSASDANHTGTVFVPNMAVRRLTPNECYRLQGFPDNWGRIPWKGKPAEECPDGPQYKAAGNSMAVPVMAFIGKRIAEVEAKGHQS